jgi:hypothetical protein
MNMPIFEEGFSAYVGAMQIWAEIRYETMPNRHQTPNSFIFIENFINLHYYTLLTYAENPFKNGHIHSFQNLFS